MTYYRDSICTKLLASRTRKRPIYGNVQKKKNVNQKIFFNKIAIYLKPTRTDVVSSDIVLTQIFF